MSEDRDDRPVTLPMWVVLNLVHDAYGECVLADTIAIGMRAFEAPAIIARAIDKAGE